MGSSVVMPIELERTYRFSAAHRYTRPEWSDDENFRRFGRCSWAPGHGHNYRLTLWVTGEIDPTTGFLIDLPALDELVRTAILDRVDHRSLNEAVERFRPGGEIPSSEALVGWIAEELAGRIPGAARLARVRLAEDDDLAAVWSSGPIA